MIRAISVLTLVVPSGQPRPNSSQIVARSSSAVIFGIKDKGHIRPFGDQLEKAATNRSLPCPDLAGQKHEAAVAGSPVQHVGEGLPMPLAHVKAGRVRDNRKRFFFQAEVFFVHRIR